MPTSFSCLSCDLAHERTSFDISCAQLMQLQLLRRRRSGVIRTLPTVRQGSRSARAETDVDGARSPQQPRARRRWQNPGHCVPPRLQVHVLSRVPPPQQQAPPYVSLAPDADHAEKRVRRRSRPPPSAPPATAPAVKSRRRKGKNCLPGRPTEWTLRTCNALGPQENRDRLGVPPWRLRRARTTTSPLRGSACSFESARARVSEAAVGALFILLPGACTCVHGP